MSPHLRFPRVRRRVMPRDAVARAQASLRARLATRRVRGEEGFVLLESVMAIALISIIMAALAGFTLSALTTTNEQRSRQAAAQIATSVMAALRSIPTSDLVAGRDVASVDAQFSSAPAAVAPALASMNKVSDSSAAVGAGATATVPTSPVTQVINNITYSTSTYLGTCIRSTGLTGGCATTGAGVNYLRAVVAVTWKNTECPSTACTYVTSTLVNNDNDPVFNVNRAEPPIAPKVDGPGNQLNTRGALVSFNFAVQDGTGVGNNTWQITSGTLPVGLVLSASGTVSGTPTANVSATPLTVTVTDAFGRSGSANFTWTIVSPPTVTTPAAQTSVQGKPITNLNIASTCPNTPCTFSMANGPAGLSINANTGVISGTPTTIATYSNVTVTITDKDGVAVATNPFTWTVNTQPSITWPGNLAATVGAVKSVPITYTCQTATCTVQLMGTTIPGLGLSATTPNTTNNVTTSLVVNGPSGTIYIAGTVQATAVPTGTSTAYAPQMRITDGNASQANSATGTWVAYVKPTIGALGTRSVTETASRSVAIAYTCPNTPCTATLTNPVPGLGLSTTSTVSGANSTTSLTLASTSGTIYVKGVVSTTAVTTGNSRAYGMSLTIADPDAMTATTNGTWTAYVEPSVNHPGSQATEPSQNVAIQLTAACPNGGCTYAAQAQVGNDPTWYNVAINSSGLLTYSSAPAGTYQLRVTVTDADGVTDTTIFPLTVQTFTLAIPNQSTSRPFSGTKVVTLNAASYITPAAGDYTFTLSGQPSWLTINANTGVLTATLTSSSSSDSSITVTATSKASGTSTVADSFRWSLT